MFILCGLNVIYCAHLFIAGRRKQKCSNDGKDKKDARDETEDFPDAEGGSPHIEIAIAIGIGVLSPRRKRKRSRRMRPEGGFCMGPPAMNGMKDWGCGSRAFPVLGVFRGLNKKYPTAQHGISHVQGCPLRFVHLHPFSISRNLLIVLTCVHEPNLD